MNVCYIFIWKLMKINMYVSEKVTVWYFPHFIFNLSFEMYTCYRSWWWWKYLLIKWKTKPNRESQKEAKPIPLTHKCMPVHFPDLCLEKGHNCVKITQFPFRSCIQFLFIKKQRCLMWYTTTFVSCIHITVWSLYYDLFLSH